MKVTFPTNELRSSSCPQHFNFSTTAHSLLERNPSALEFQSFSPQHLRKIRRAYERSSLLLSFLQFWKRILCKHGWRQSLHNRMILSPPLTSSLPTDKFREEDTAERPVLVLFVTSLSAPYVDRLPRSGHAKAKTSF